MTGSGVLGLVTTVAIPVACIGASTWGWRNDGSRKRVVLFTLLGVLIACLAFALAGRALDLDPFAMTFVVLTTGLAAGNVMLGKKRLNLT